MSIKALTFDVFGTVVDWRSSIIRDGAKLTRDTGIEVDWETLADEWRAGYGPAMDRVRNSVLPWRTIDQLHRMILDGLAPRFGLEGLSDDRLEWLNRAWHRLDPWPDAVGGIGRLKSRFVVATLSNGNVSLLTEMGKYAGLPWDCILSAELAGHYKPDLEVYRKAATLLGRRMDEVMMVAAHTGDLSAAREAGMMTALVPRPREFGPNEERAATLADGEPFDYTATDFHDLADQLIPLP